MKAEHRLNLKKIKSNQTADKATKEQLELQHKLADSISNFGKVLADFGDMLSGLHSTLSKLSEKETPDYSQQFVKLLNKTHNVGQAIEKLTINPVVNVSAPVVNVEPVIVNQDKLSKYTRVNSQIDPEGIYHGFVDSDSNWFIRLETEVNGLRQASRFAVGKGKLATNWSKRKSLDYKPYDQVEIA